MIEELGLAPFASRDIGHCPAASASSPRSARRWCASPTCCCSTSRPAPRRAPPARRHGDDPRGDAPARHRHRRRDPRPFARGPLRRPRPRHECQGRSPRPASQKTCLRIRRSRDICGRRASGAPQPGARCWSSPISTVYAGHARSYASMTTFPQGRDPRLLVGTGRDLRSSLGLCDQVRPGAEGLPAPDPRFPRRQGPARRARSCLRHRRDHPRLLSAEPRVTALDFSEAMSERALRQARQGGPLLRLGDAEHLLDDEARPSTRPITRHLVWT